MGRSAAEEMLITALCEDLIPATASARKMSGNVSPAPMLPKAKPPIFKKLLREIPSQSADSGRKS